MKKKTAYLIGIILSLALSFQISQAQEEDVANVVMIADVNIYESKLISQDKNKFDFSFDLSNGKGIQSGIGYVVTLIQENENGGQTLIDEKIYAKNIQLSDGEVIKEKLEYTAPEYLKGEYDLWVTAKNNNGLSLALADLGKIKLDGTDQYLQIINNSCYLKVGGEDIKYGPRQGVDIKQGEILTLNCDVINNFASEIEAIPTVKTHWRSTSGEQIDDSKKRDKLSFKPKEKKTIAVDLTIPSDPQAYEIRLGFLDNQGKIVSNEADAHYVLSGLSATIQNISLDKNYYKKGDQAKLAFFWSGSADGFFGSRLGGNDNVSKYYIQINIQDKQGKKCADDVTKEMDKNKVNLEEQISILSNCEDPTVKISIKDEKGGVLDESELKAKSEQIPSKNESKQLIALVLAFFIIVLLLVIIAKKVKSSKVFILFFLISGTFFIGGEADAALFSGTYRAWPQYTTSEKNGSDHTVNMTINLNKTSFNPGESISASIAGFSALCSNSFNDYALGMTINGSTSKRGGYYIESDITGSDVFSDARVYAYSHNFTAPTTPGTYSAKFFYEDRRCKPQGYAGRMCYFDSGVYVISKTSQVNYASSGASPYGTSWTTAQMRTALKNYGGIYKHYNDYHVAEGVWGCMANCSASEVSQEIIYTVASPAVNGSCGTKNTTYPSTTSAWPAGTFCATGTASPVNPSFPAAGSTTNWQCGGSGGGSTASCSASVASPAVNGSCGTRSTSYPSITSAWPAGTFCATGTASPANPSFPAAGSTTNWQCGGSGGGSTASCSASVAAGGGGGTVINGVCGTKNTTYPSTISAWPAGTFCATGTASPANPSFPAAGSTVSWQCLGSSGGATASCLTTHQAAAIPAPILNFSVSPSTVTSGGAATLTWSTSNASSCFASGDWSGWKASGGGTETKASITSNKTYTMECWNSSGGTTGEKTVNVSVVAGGGGASTGMDDITITAACVQKTLPEFCDKPCGPGNKIVKTLKADCSIDENITGTCNEGACPLDMEFREVQP